jgi:type III secretory pathway component EscS
VRTGSSDPLRRLGLVLLAWAPPGIAAAAVIGQITGCGSYSVACDGTDPFLPWVAQAVILGLLLLAPPLARLFAAGAIGLVIGLVPATAGVIALGGAGSSAAPPVLSAVLAIAWLAGIAWGFRQLLASAGPPGHRA